MARFFQVKKTGKEALNNDVFPRDFARRAAQYALETQKFRPNPPDFCPVGQVFQRVDDGTADGTAIDVRAVVHGRGDRSGDA